MAKGKKVRTRGKISLSKRFQNFKKGDQVAVAREISLNPGFPERLQGQTGLVLERRGNSYVISIKEGSKEKKFIIEPVHLKRIKT